MAGKKQTRPYEKVKKKKINIKRTLKGDQITKLRATVLKAQHGEEDESLKEVKAKRKGKTFTVEELDAIASSPDESEGGSAAGRSRASHDAMIIRRKQILRLLLRGVPKPTISKYLNISTATLYRDIEAINDEMESEVNDFNIPRFIGYTLAFYDEVRNIALRMATDKDNKDKRIINASLQTALKAEADKHQYLRLTGLYGEAEMGKAMLRGSMQDDTMQALDTLAMELFANAR